MRYFQFRNEGETVNNGFNFYRLKDRASFGFVFRYGKKIPKTNLGSKLFSFRYSKKHRMWFIKNYDVTSFS